METTKFLLFSLVNDLKRAALALHRKSPQTAKTFTQEALKTIEQIEKKTVNTYLLPLLAKTGSLLRQNASRDLAENLLLQSTLLQNFAIKNAKFSHGSKHEP